MPGDKYKELYDLSNKLLEEEHGRFHRISQKATNYLSTVSLLLGIATIFGKEAIALLIPPKTLLEWLLLNVAVMVFASLAVTWWTIFRAYRFEGLLTRPLSELIEFYQSNELINIYFAMAKANANAREANIKLSNQKAKLLEYGHKMILATASLAVLFASLYFIYLWSPAHSTKVDNSSATNIQGNVFATPEVGKQTNEPSAFQITNQTNQTTNTNERIRKSP